MYNPKIKSITLVDYGLACRYTLMRKVKEFAGTPWYVAPEVADVTGPGYDFKSDIWSIGVVLHEFLTGSVPIDCDDDGDETIEAIAEVRKKGFKIDKENFKGISGHAFDIVKSCLNPNP